MRVWVTRMGHTSMRHLYDLYECAIPVIFFFVRAQLIHMAYTSVVGPYE